MPSVQRVTWAQFRVAVVSLVALTILVTTLYLLTGGTLFQEKATLYLYVPDATGIGPGSPVEVNGIQVGKVAAVALSGSNDPRRVVRVTLAVQRDQVRSIPAESYAQLSVSSPVGDKYVDITSNGSGERRPNTEIAYKEEPDLFKTLDLLGLEKQLRQVDSILTDIETGRSEVGQFVIGTQMYDSLRKRFAQIEQSVRKAAATTTSVGQALYTDRLYRQILDPVQKLDLTLARLQSGQGAAGQLLRDNAPYEQARATVKDLRQTVAKLERSPFLASDQMYNDWNRGLASLVDSVQRVNTDPLMTTSLLYDNLNGAAREIINQVQDFKKDPRKYFRFQVF